MANDQENGLKLVVKTILGEDHSVLTVHPNSLLQDVKRMLTIAKGLQPDQILLVDETCTLVELTANVVTQGFTEGGGHRLVCLDSSLAVENCKRITAEWRKVRDRLLRTDEAGIDLLYHGSSLAVQAVPVYIFGTSTLLYIFKKLEEWRSWETCKKLQGGVEYFFSCLANCFPDAGWKTAVSTLFSRISKSPLIVKLMEYLPTVGTFFSCAAVTVFVMNLGHLIWEWCQEGTRPWDAFLNSSVPADLMALCSQILLYLGLPATWPVAQIILIIQLVVTVFLLRKQLCNLVQYLSNWVRGSVWKATRRLSSCERQRQEGLRSAADEQDENICCDCVREELGFDMDDFMCPIKLVVPRPNQLVHSHCGHVFELDESMEAVVQKKKRCPVCRSCISLLYLCPWIEGREIVRAVLRAGGPRILASACLRH